MNKEFIRDFPVKDLIPYERNPRVNKHAVESLAKAIQRVGNNDPIEVNEQNVILCGHTRKMALDKLGIKKTDIIVISGLTEDQQREYRITNNKTGEIADWDFDILEADFTHEQLYEFGFDLKDLTRPDVVEDEAPPVPETPRTVRGDIYTLGRHRVMCGDSTMIDDVDKLMDGENANLSITDPPYGIGFKYNKHIDFKGDEYELFCDDWFSNLEIKTIDRNIIIFSGWAYNGYWINKKPYDIFYWIVKNKHSGGKNSHFRNTEPVIMFQRFIKQFDFDFIMYDSIEKIKGVGGEHTCPKPVKLMIDFIEKASIEKNIILDVFLGSGTNLIACEQTNRICYGMELDEKYCDVIVQRWVNFTGGQVMLNGQPVEWSKTA